jgi:hypothetical protein
MVTMASPILWVGNQNWILMRWRRPSVMVTLATTELRTVELKPRPDS